jgi:hypothetical protein
VRFGHKNIKKNVDTTNGGGLKVFPAVETYFVTAKKYIGRMNDEMSLILIFLDLLEKYKSIKVSINI